MTDRPPFVIVLKDDDLKGLQDSVEGRSLLRRPDVLLVGYPPPEPPEIEQWLIASRLWRPETKSIPGFYRPDRYAKTLDSLRSQSLLQFGVTLVQSPYDPANYADVSLAQEVFAMEKHAALTTLSNRLGATLVKVNQVEIKSTAGTDSIDLSGSHPVGIEVGAKYNKEVAAHLDGRLSMEKRFRGGPPNIQAARAWLQENRLSGKSVFKSLIDEREGDNPMTLCLLRLSLTDETSSTIEAAAQIKIPGQGKVDGNWKSKSSVRAEYRLTYRIEFEYNPKTGAPKPTVLEEGQRGA